MQQSAIKLVSSALKINQPMSNRYLSKFVTDKQCNHLELVDRAYKIKNKDQFLVEFLAFINRNKYSYKTFDSDVFKDPLFQTSTLPEIMKKPEEKKRAPRVSPEQKIKTLIESAKNNQNVKTNLSTQVKSLLSKEVYPKTKQNLVISISTLDEAKANEVFINSKNEHQIKQLLKKENFNQNSITDFIDTQMQFLLSSPESFKEVFIANLDGLTLLVRTFYENCEDRAKKINNRKHKESEYNYEGNLEPWVFEELQYQIVPEKLKYENKGNLITVSGIKLIVAYFLGEEVQYKEIVNLEVELKKVKDFVILEKIDVKY